MNFKECAKIKKIELSAPFDRKYFDIQENAELLIDSYKYAIELLNNYLKEETNNDTEI